MTDPSPTLSVPSRDYSLFDLQHVIETALEPLGYSCVGSVGTGKPGTIKILRPGTGRFDRPTRTNTLCTVSLRDGARFHAVSCGYRPELVFLIPQSQMTKKGEEERVRTWLARDPALQAWVKKIAHALPWYWGPGLDAPTAAVPTGRAGWSSMTYPKGSVYVWDSAANSWIPIDLSAGETISSDDPEQPPTSSSTFLGRQTPASSLRQMAFGDSPVDREETRRLAREVLSWRAAACRGGHISKSLQSMSGGLVAWSPWTLEDTERYEREHGIGRQP